MGGTADLVRLYTKVLETESCLQIAVEAVLSGQFGQGAWELRAAPLVPRADRRLHEGQAKKTDSGAKPWSGLSLSDSVRIMTGRVELTSRNVDNWILFQPFIKVTRRDFRVKFADLNRIRAEFFHAKTDWFSLPPPRVTEILAAWEDALTLLDGIPAVKNFRRRGGSLGRLS